MELRQLRCFEILAEELHFARAADRLGTTQSGVSRLIAGLETTLGGKLFNRAKRSSVSLTATGALFLPEARAILRQAERGETIGLSLSRCDTPKDMPRVCAGWGEGSAGHPRGRIVLE